MFIEAIVYSDYLKGGEQWISLTGFSSTLKYCSQKPPGTVSEIKKLKNFLGEHALRPPTFRKSTSSITFLSNEKAFEVFNIVLAPPLSLAIVAFAPPP